MSYLLHELNMISIYAILALSLNLLVGYAGVLSLSHAAFYGIGAYVSSLLLVEAGFPFLPAMGVGVAAAVLASLLIAFPSLRLRDDYFVLASLGFQIIVFSVLYNWVGLTRGPFGISGIPHPVLLGVNFDTAGSYLIFNVAIASACGVLLYAVMRSPFGRVLKAIRDDELAAAALGKNIPRLKITAFAAAAGFAAVAGALFAGYLRYIDPTSFTLQESIFILSIIIIGGAGNVSGPLVGTVLMILLPEALRFVGIPDNVAPNLRQIIYGALIILIMRHRPEGVLGEYRYQ
jgi:branched-chain amino acid transport system permease protein